MQWNGYFDEGAFARCGLQMEGITNRFHPFTHAHDAPAMSIAWSLRRLEANASIANLQKHPFGLVFQPQPGAIGVGVTADIGQRLLYHAVENHLDQVVQSPPFAVHFKNDFQPQIVPALIHEMSYGGDQSEVIELRRAQIVHNLADGLCHLEIDLLQVMDQFEAVRLL